MLPFIIGVILGGTIGFLAAAVFSINNYERDERQPPKETGENDARSE